MRFLTIIKTSEDQEVGGPPPALFEAMDALIAEQMAAGILLDTGGLLPSSGGVEVRVRGGEMSVVDGPFTETREVVGGWAFTQARTKEEAVEQARRFMQIHIDHFPGWDGTCEVRQCADGPDPEGPQA